MRLADIAALVGGEIRGADPEAEIRGVNTLDRAAPDELSFLANPRYRGRLNGTRAAAVLMAPDDPAEVPSVRVGDPYLAFALVQRHFHPEPESTGLRHPSAVVEPDAELASDAELGAHCYIGHGVRIGAGTRVLAGCVIEDGATVGERCVLGARSVVAAGCVLGDGVRLQPGAVGGSDGFGSAWDGQRHLKIPQVGRVVLEDDVEIGANACIDRGAIGDTVIERGVKLDNLVQIGHNARIGAFTVMAAQAGVSGSTRIGAGCQVGGQAGMAGHIEIADGCRIAAQAGVIGDLKEPGTYGGMPAIPHRIWLKASALFVRLPEMMHTLKRLARAREHSSEE
ncbi:MAG: UDP-3-O-(3-hydroxymyristoyl)glucosamine N-acyltransferase [Mariprofundaceae bacterium]